MYVCIYTHYMHACVCMSLIHIRHIHVTIHIGMDAYRYECMYLCIYVCRQTCIYVNTYILYTCMQNTCVCIYAYVYVCRKTCMGMYVCMYIHKYTYCTPTYVVMNECVSVHMYLCVCVYAIWMHTFRYVYL